LTEQKRDKSQGEISSLKTDVHTNPHTFYLQRKTKIKRQVGFSRIAKC